MTEHGAGRTRIPTPWLGDRRGHLADWVTQRWVELTGRAVDVRRAPWLESPMGSTRGIGVGYFRELAAAQGLEVRDDGPEAGLLADFGQLAGPGFDTSLVQPGVADFYEHTGAYELDAWAEWCGPFRPFGGLLALLFSRRLQQLNVPLSALDTSRGITSEVLRLVEPGTGEVRYTAWVRQLVGTGDVLYAGAYSRTLVPGHDGPCVKVAFPLPNGNALVLMKPALHEDGSVSVASDGRRFGDPGFYFTIRRGEGLVARYVRTLKERIHVYEGDTGEVRADHELWIWGARFLRLHYRMRRRAGGGGGGAPPDQPSGPGAFSKS